MPPQRVWFLRRIGLKMGMHFAHAFWSGIGYGFWGNYGSVWTYLSFQFQMYTKERDINMQIRISFVGVESKKWWHNFLEARSENGCEKWNFLVWNKVKIWRTVWHTPTKKIQEYSPPPPDTAAQIALKLIRRKRNQHQISIFIYLFIYSKPFAIQTLTLLLCQTCRHFSKSYNEYILLTSL